MPPKVKALTAALASAVREIWNSPQRDTLSVNVVRKRVEDDLDLEDGFFKSATWKAKSKNIIMSTVDEMNALEANAKPESSPAKPKLEPKGRKNGVKRESSEEQTPAKKRQKVEPQSPAPKKAVKDQSESDLTDLSDVEDLKSATKQRKVIKRVIKKSTKLPESDEEPDDVKEEPSGVAGKVKEDEESESDSKLKKAEVESSSEEKPKAESKDVEVKESVEGPGDSDSPLSDVKDDFSEDEKKEEQKSVINYNSDSSMSVVHDKPPKKKGKSKGGAAPSKGLKKARASGTKSMADVSQDETEVKKLQGQLVKCGIRKIWAFELKKYGDDSKAKIKHLRNMLKEIGMDGRFSEAKAKEIKERRELAADLEAVQEMNKSWGIGGRASRSRSNKPLKESDEDDEKDGAGGSDGEESDSEVKTFAKARGSAKARAGLAFLGDDSESD